MRQNQDRYFSMAGKLQSVASPRYKKPHYVERRDRPSGQSAPRPVIARPEGSKQSQLLHPDVAADFSLRRHIAWPLTLLFLAFFLAILSSTQAMAKEDISTDKATKVQIQETYGKLLLYFIQNKGQVDEKVKFYEKGSGHSTFFTKEGVYLLLGSSKQVADNSKKAEDKPEIVANQSKPSSSNIPSPLMGEGRVGVTPVITSPPLLKGGMGGLTPQFTYTLRTCLL